MENLLSRVSPAAIAAAKLRLPQFSIQFASIVVVWYDYFLTFSSEVEHIWRRKIGWSTFAYIFTRYPLVANVLYAVAISGKLSHCDHWYKFVGAISVLGRASVIAVFTVRTVAIYNHNKYVTAWLGFTGLTCIALDITHVPGLRCSGPITTAPAIPTALSAIVLVFEFSAASLIGARAILVFRKPASTKKDGLIRWILKHGLLYFCAVFFLQMVSTFLNFAAEDNFKRLMNAITLPISCLLTARFMLKLRQLNKEAIVHTSVRSLSTFQVADRIGAAITDEFGDPVLNGGITSRSSELDATASRGEELELDVQVPDDCEASGSH